MKEKKVPAIRFQGFTDDWEQRKVGNLYDFKNGLNKSKEFFGTGVPIVNFTDVFHHRGLIASQLYGRVSLTPEEVHNFLVKKGDIFFTRTSETIEEIGYPSVMLDTPKDTVFSGFVLRGRSIEDSDPLDDLFKKYVFFTKSFRSEMTKKSSMTTRALTSGTSIKKMLFQYPESKKEQHQIGLCITELDNLIALHQHKLTKLQLLKKSMLTKMFPKDGARVPEIRFQGFHGDWKERKLGEVMESYSGGTPSVGIKEYYGGDIPFIRSAEINSESTELFLTNAGLNNSSARLVSQGDILYALYGATSGEVGRARLSGAINQAILAIKPNNGYDSEYITQWLQKNKQNITDTYLQGGQGNLSGTIVKEFLVKFPTYNEQHKIGRYFRNIDNTIVLYQRKLSKLQKIKQAMLSKLFV